MLVDHTCTAKDDDPPKQRLSAFGQALLAETFGFTLPTKAFAMKQIASGDAERDKLITLWSGDSTPGAHSTLRQVPFIFTPKGNMVRQQRLDADVAKELHELPRWPGKVAMCDSSDIVWWHKKRCYRSAFEIGTERGETIV